MTRATKPRGNRRPATRLNLTARQVAILGTMSDPDAAERLGTTAYAIRTERRARGIAPFRTGGEREGAGRPPAAGVKQTERLGLTMTEPEMAEIRDAVPEGATLGRWVVEAALMRARAQEASQAVVEPAGPAEIEDRIASGHEALERTPSDPPTVRAAVATLLAPDEGEVHFACPTCRLSLSVNARAVDRGVPWHFDHRPQRPGGERDGCPATGSALPADRKFIAGRRDAAG